MSEVASHPDGRASTREPLLWLALAAALSPTLLDFVQHTAQEPWARPFLLVAALGLAAAWRDPRRAPRRPFGFLLVAAGVGLALATVGGGMTRLGRPGLPLALVGMALALGRPVLPIALLACWAVPPPKALLVMLSPGLESLLARAAVGITRSLGGTASFVKEGLILNGASLQLDAPDGGLPLAFAIGGLAWWSVAHRAGGLRESGAAAVRLAPWGLAAQAGLLCLAIATLAAGGAGEGARAVLDHGGWAAVAVALLVTTRRTARTARAIPLGVVAEARR